MHAFEIPFSNVHPKPRNARSDESANGISSERRAGGARGRKRIGERRSNDRFGRNDRREKEGIGNAGTKSETRLTSVAALHPARTTAVLIRIQYILGCIFPVVFRWARSRAPFADHRVETPGYSKRKNVRVRASQQPSKPPKKIHRSNNATHTTLIDEPRETEGASIGRFPSLRPAAILTTDENTTFTDPRETTYFDSRNDTETRPNRDR